VATKQKQAAPRVIEVERGYTYQEVGDHLGVSWRQVKRWCDDGKLGYTRLPRGRRITPSHLAAFIAANNVEPLE
jgi:excisionase family DNA binding protein